MSKLFRATLVAKKSHPDSPESIIIHSDQFNTQKDFSDACIEELKQIEDVALWFAPKVERVTQEEFDAANQSEITPQDCAADGIDDDSQIEDAGLITESVNVSSDISSHQEVVDQYHYFQYAKGYPIIIKLSKLNKNVRVSYMFDSNQFLEIDKEFSTLENGLINALGYVIEDCIDAGIECHEWAKLTVKGIGGRNPDRFFHESIMTPQEVVDFFDSEPETKLDTWEANDDIKYKKLYSRIVDVISDYKGDQMPSASKCYVHLVSVVPEKHKGRDDIESRILREIAQVKNPHNFTNSTNSVQIMMMAFRDLDSADRLREASSAMQRLGEKFRDDEAACDQKSGPESLPTTEESLPVEDKIEPEVVKPEPKAAESLPSKSIGEPEMVNIEPEGLPVDDLGFDFDDKKSEPDEMIERNFDDSESKTEKSDFEKLIESYNEKIEALGLGEVIVFNDMPNAIYHAVVGTSSSKIKDAMKSLMYFNGKHNTKEIEQEVGAQFDIGNVFHSICLEPDLTSKEYIKEPSGDGVPAKPTQPQIDKYNEWRKLGSPEKSENPKAWPTDLMFERVGFWNDFYESSNGLYPIAAQDWELAESMVNSAMSDSDSSKILKHPSRRCEVSYFKRCDTTGMIIKARPDLELGRIIADLKSIALRGNFDEKYLLTALRKEVFNRGYHISAAMYLDITGKDQFLWIFTNKQKGYHWTATLRASDEILEKGREIYFEYRQKIADAYQSGVWKKPESITSKFNPETNKTELPEV